MKAGGRSMILSKTKMQKIVEELYGTINRDINIMDKTGKIIASTDITRLGSYHQGAQRIINQKMAELLIGDGIYFEGAKRGINLPIYINDEIVGVVGITGERKEVEPFGKIIQKMTEIMISDEYQKDQKQLVENTKRNFVYTWLFETLQEEEKEKEKIALSGKLLGIDVSLKRIVVVLYISALEEHNNVEKQILNNRIVKYMCQLIGEDPQNIVVQIGAKIIILLYEEKAKKVSEKMEEINVQVEQHYHVKIAGGIGSVGSEILKIRQSYKEAEICCDLMINIKSMGIRVYGDVDMELLLQSIPYQNRTSFLNRTFQECTQKDKENFMLLLRVLIDNNGAINQTADQLFLHKNTVQYRLSKLKELTGYDPRIMKEMVPLYIAMMIYEEDKNIL
jgi:carbohydrate diacid regulator